ncbi:structure-specific endonuclease subunit SLX4 isoform X2 [Acipenser ruthenus]|uniref:structure-specific endonuclease subunit SLX4 isoform X2 n=1 Tax=Acipenser ruthenus TaxID=7906 RepID=UPI00274122FF|nr:structure-specific endonuclease subunit SLX4 isoform X2 [Acipenser ruthenus]
MEDSDDDFTELCAKLLKRVKKKGWEGGQKEVKSTGEEECTPTVNKSREKGKKASGKSRAKPGEEATSKKEDLGSSAVPENAQDVPTGGIQGGEEQRGTPTTGDAGDVRAPPPSRRGDATGISKDTGCSGAVGPRIKDLIVQRMQQFKRTCPERMRHNRAEIKEENITKEQRDAVGLCLQGDEALAREIQGSLQRESLLEGGQELEGLFFCQICQKDLSAMNSTRRTQHINRCLDESEGSSGPAVSRIPDCPICGKHFSSSKSRGSHLKRCASEMGILPQVLLEAVQRQAAESQSSGTAGTEASGHPPGGRRKRKGSNNTRRPVKKPKTKAEPLDEDTMIAMAMSRSMQEQETPGGAELASMAQSEGALPIHWKPKADKRRRKNGPPPPTPLLLVQDPQAAFTRVQERAAILLLREREDIPSTPSLPISKLPGGQKPAQGDTSTLWDRSALWDNNHCSLQSFYTPALAPPIEPWKPAQSKSESAVGSSSAESQTTDCVPPSPALIGTQTDPLVRPEPHSQPASQNPRGNQTLCDLMELADEGLTLTQWGHRTDCREEHSVTQSTSKDAMCGDIPLSGFVPSPENRSVGPVSHNSVALSKLASDLGGMVNNPQLSDVQFQTDSGEVLFAHSFLLYARCPLMAQAVHDEGFSVEEDGIPKSRRLLLSEMSAKAVSAFLQYLYTAHTSITAAIVPELLGLAVRFGVVELVELCESYTAGEGNSTEDAWAGSQGEEEEGGEECRNRDETLQELLRSMWVDEGEEDAAGYLEVKPGALEGGENDDQDNRVDDEELEEIYEFAATQRKVAGESEGDSREDCPNTESEEDQNDLGQDEDSGHQSDGKKQPEAVCWLSSSEEEHNKGNANPDELSGKLEVIAHPSNVLCPIKEGSENEEEETLEDTDTSGRKEKGNTTENKETSLSAEEKDRVVLATPESSTEQDPNVSLDKSYERMFSESWDDFMEPSQQSTEMRERCKIEQAIKKDVNPVSSEQSPDSDSSVIDLSASPPYDSCASSFPLVGMSPKSQIFLCTSPEISAVPVLGVRSPGNNITSLSSLTDPHVDTKVDQGGTQENKNAEDRLTESFHKPKEESPRKGTSFGLGQLCHLTPEKTNHQSRSSLLSHMDPHQPSPVSKQADVIILLDSDEEIELDLKGKESKSFSKEAKASSFECSQKERNEAAEPDGIGSMGLNNSLDGRGLNLRLSSGSDVGNEESINMETSWMVPGTPAPSTSVRQGSTQSFQEMQGIGARINLFSKSYTNEPGLLKLNRSTKISHKSTDSQSSLEISGLNRASHFSKPPSTEVLKRDSSNHSKRKRHSSAGSRSSMDITGSNVFSKATSCSQIATHSSPEPKRAQGASVTKVSPRRQKDAGSPVTSSSFLDQSSPAFVAPPNQIRQTNLCSNPTSSDCALSKKESLETSAKIIHGSTDLYKSSLEVSEVKSFSNTTNNLKLDLSECSTRTKQSSTGSQSSLEIKDNNPFLKPSSSSQISLAKHSSLEPKKTQGDSVISVRPSRHENAESPGKGHSSFHDSSLPVPAVPDAQITDFDTGGLPLDPTAIQEATVGRQPLNSSVIEVEDSEGEETSPPQAAGSFCLEDEPPIPFDNDAWGIPGFYEPDQWSSRGSSPVGNASVRSAVSPGGGKKREAVTPLRPALPHNASSPLPCSIPDPLTQAGPSGAGQPGYTDSNIWDDDDWEEASPETLPLSQRLSAAAPAQRVKQLRTPVAPRKTAQGPVVPITPMPTYSDMDTPDLKTRLNRYGVRPLPKRQMILKLKQIHQYTHQVVSSDSEGEVPSSQPLHSSVQASLTQPKPASTTAARKRNAASQPVAHALGPGPASVLSRSSERVDGPPQEGFKDPAGRKKQGGQLHVEVEGGSSDETEPLSASQRSTASSTAGSEDSFSSSQRSNPEELGSLGDEEDEEDGVPSSQAAARTAAAGRSEAGRNQTGGQQAARLPGLQLHHLHHRQATSGLHKQEGRQERWQEGRQGRQERCGQGGRLRDWAVVVHRHLNAPGSHVAGLNLLDQFSKFPLVDCCIVLVSLICLQFSNFSYSKNRLWAYLQTDSFMKFGSY